MKPLTFLLCCQALQAMAKEGGHELHIEHEEKEVVPPRLDAAMYGIEDPGPGLKVPYEYQHSSKKRGEYRAYFYDSGQVLIEAASPGAGLKDPTKEIPFLVQWLQEARCEDLPIKVQDVLDVLAQAEFPIKINKGFLLQKEGKTYTLSGPQGLVIDKVSLEMSLRRLKGVQGTPKPEKSSRKEAFVAMAESMGPLPTTMLATMTPPEPPKEEETFEVVVQKWMTRDSWSGPEDAGMTVHLTEADRKKYVYGYFDAERKRNPSGNTPEYYRTVDGEGVTVKVSKAVYEEVKASKEVFSTYRWKLENNKVLNTNP